MRLIISLVIALLFCFSLIFGQKIEKPVLTPKPVTEEHKLAIRQGIALHDKKDFDGAIAKYKQVLAENPDSTLALYELALSYYNKKDMVNALETALKGSKYRSDELPLFYGVIANITDDAGKPDEAIKIYRNAIKIISDDKEFERHVSSLYFNLGVTYARQKKYLEARQELKKAVEYNYHYPSPHYLLSEVYYGSKYKVPAMLAAARFVVLEYNTNRTLRSAAIFAAGLEGAKKDEATGNINIFLDLNAPKDEGDFGMYELLLGTLMTVKEDKDKEKSKGELFAEAVDSFIGLVSEDKNLKKTFVGKYYVPFMAALKMEGHSAAFAYLVLRQTGGNPEAEKWTQLNSDKVMAMINWAKGYRLTEK